MYYFFNCDCIKGAKEYIADGKADLIITDPPFGIDGDKTAHAYNRNEANVLPGYVEIKQSDYLRFTLDWIGQAARILRPGGQIYVVSGYTNLMNVLLALNTAGLQEVNHIIWKYNFGLPTKRKFCSSHYHILLYWKPTGKKKDRPVFNSECRFPVGQKGEGGKDLHYADMEDVWFIRKEYHPGQVKTINKLPDELIKKMLQYSSTPEDNVCDFFMGNFTTASVCRDLGYDNFIGFEISKEAFGAGVAKMAKKGVSLVTKC